MGGFKSFIQKGQTWSRLSPKERELFLQALFLLPLVALSLQLGGLKRTQAALMQFPQPALSEQSKAQFPFILTTMKMVQIAAHYSRGWTTCLRKSLVLWYLLRRQGIATELQIGVQMEPGQFQAHAWVEYQGYVLGDRQGVRQHFTAFDRLNSELNRHIALF